MTKATKKLSRARLRRNPGNPARAQLYIATYALLDRAQLCADPLGQLKEARQHLARLIASYEVRR